MQSDNIKNVFINKYTAVGEEKFYKFLITYALNRIVEPQKEGKDNINPALELLEYYDMFLKLYRRESEDIYLDLAKQFRKASHKIYRLMLQKKLTDRNKKFLNLV